MSDERVLVATGRLRDHARYLQASEEFLEGQAYKLDQGMIPVTAWGVPNYSNEDGDSLPDDRGRASGWVIPSLR